MLWTVIILLLIVWSLGMSLKIATAAMPVVLAFAVLLMLANLFVARRTRA